MPDDGASGNRPDILTALSVVLAVVGLVIAILAWFFPDDSEVKTWTLLVGGAMLLVGATWWVLRRIRSRGKPPPTIHAVGATVVATAQVKGTGVVIKSDPQWIPRVSADPLLQELYPQTAGVLLSLHPGAIGDVTPPARYYCRVSDGTKWWDTEGKDVDGPGQPLVQVAFPGDFLNPPALPIHDGPYTAIWSWRYGSTKQTLATQEFKLPLEG
jgi:hypothetical protein